MKQWEKAFDEDIKSIKKVRSYLSLKGIIKLIIVNIFLINNIKFNRRVSDKNSRRIAKLINFIIE